MPVTVIRPPTVTRRPQPARSGSRSSDGGRSTGRNARKGTGLRTPRYGAYTPAPPPATPFQPGAGPAPLLGPWFMLGLGAGVLLKLLWDMLNYRPPEEVRPPEEGDEFVFSPGVNRQIDVIWDRRTSYGSYTRCDDGTHAFGPAEEINGLDNYGGGLGTSLVVTQRKRTMTAVCGTGSGSGGGAVPWLQLRKADGSLEVLSFGQASAVTPGTNRGSATQYIDNIRALSGGQWKPLTVVEPGEFAPDMRPLVPEPQPEVEPLTEPEPALPISPPLPMAPPDVAPAPVPVTPGQRPGQTPARPPAPGVAPSPSPSPGPTPVPAEPAPQPVPAEGPLPVPEPTAVPTTPGDALIIDDLIETGTGQAPEPNLPAMAQELGRIERKTEMLLERPSAGDIPDGLGELLEELLANAIRAAIEDLMNDQPGGSFELYPSCPSSTDTGPAPPIVVEWTASDNPLEDLRKRTEALAMLIQAHKDLGQPMCKTAISGRPVTVNFISDPE